MDKRSIEQLIDRYLAGNCTSSEKALIERFYLEEILKRDSLVPATDPLQKKKAMWEAIFQKTNPEEVKKQKMNPRLWIRTVAAAAILIIIGTVIYFYPQKINKQQTVAALAYKTDVKPGGNKAILNLGNGERFILNDTGNGVITNQSGTIIEKTKDGQLVYTGDKSGTAGEPLLFNSIITPKGGQYQVTLSDGTRVWLNAASTLRFPERFTGKERNVELIGEAYFEVAKNKNMPFKVKNGKQTIEVLGTHFNINSYGDDKSSKTTLLEGLVRIFPTNNLLAFKPQILKPNQQSVLSGDLIKVIPVEADDEVAWKNGKFMFNNEELGSIMKKVARWYDVDIIYTDENMEKNTYWGTVSRFGNVSQLLKMLEMTGDVHFKIEGRRITVLK